MSQLNCNTFVCKECKRLLNPNSLSKSSEYCFAVNSGGGVAKTPFAAARCECGHIGVFPRFAKAATYLAHMMSEVSFHIDTTAWVKAYMEDPDGFLDT